MDRVKSKILAKRIRGGSSIVMTGSHMNKRSFDPLDEGVSLQSTLLAGHVSFDESDEDEPEESNNETRNDDESSLVWQVRTEDPLNLNVDALEDNELSFDHEDDECEQVQAAAATMSRWHLMGKENVPPSLKAPPTSSSRCSKGNTLDVDHLVQQGWSTSGSTTSSSSHFADSGIDAEDKTGVMLAKQLAALHRHLRPSSPLTPASTSMENKPAGTKRKLDSTSELSSTTRPATKRKALQVSLVDSQARPAFVSRIPISITRLNAKRQASMELAPQPKRPREASRLQEEPPKAPQARPASFKHSYVEAVSLESPVPPKNRVRPARGAAGCTPYHPQPKRKALGRVELAAAAVKKLEAVGGAGRRAQRPSCVPVGFSARTRAKKVQIDERSEEKVHSGIRLVVPRAELASYERRSSEVTRMARRFESLADAQRRRPVLPKLDQAAGVDRRVSGQPGSAGLVQRAKSALTETQNRPPFIRLRSPTCLKIGKLAAKKEAAVAAMRPSPRNSSCRAARGISPRFVSSPVKPSRPVRELRKIFSPSAAACRASAKSPHPALKRYFVK